VAHVDDIAAF